MSNRKIEVMVMMVSILAGMTYRTSESLSLYFSHDNMSAKWVLVGNVCQKLLVCPEKEVSGFGNFGGN